mgnify:CR=1 FL=1
MSVWFMQYEGFDPDEEPLREALCTLGNGYMATRGAAPESRAGGCHYPGTYRAGLFNRLKTTIGEHTVENESLVNLPNWLFLSFKPEGGEWFDVEKVEILSYKQELDMKRGELLRKLHFRLPHGPEYRLAQRRFVSMADAHLAGLETTVQPLNCAGTLRFRTDLDGRVVNGNVARYSDLAKDHLDPVCTSRVDDETVCLEMITKQSQIRVVEAARVRVFKNKEPVEPERELIEEEELIGWEFDVEVEKEDAVTVEKLVTLFTSRDHAVSSPAEEACNVVSRVEDYEDHLREHVLAWGRLWRDSKLGVEEDDYTARALNLYLFHIFQTVSGNTQELDVGVPARGLHGEAYRGHIFWDELFVFPILNYRIPELTRSLIRYRFRRLREARAAAKAEGYRGAMFPWQSGSNGREETQTWHLNPKSGRWLPDNSHLQRHVNIAIPFNVWQYYEVTGDLEFMASYGAELILECARFWASITTYDEAQQRYAILRVMGPDEYHEAYPDAEEPGLDNSAYNNVMVAWVLSRALEVLDLLPGDRKEDLLDILHLTKAEMDEWDRISRRLKVPFHKAEVRDGEGAWDNNGRVISQFDGYDDLEEFDWEAYEEKYDDIQRLDRILEAEGDSPNRYKVSKQADVLMLFYLLSAEELGGLFKRLGYEWDPEIIPRTIHYYTNRTSHGSTLSGVVHAWVLARSDRDRSWSFFRRALESDISDIQGGTTPEGVHLGAMAGTVDLIQRAYSGLEAREDVLRFNPCLPDDLGTVTFSIQYRRSWLEVELSQKLMEIWALPTAAGPIQISVGEDVRTLTPGSTEIFKLQ